MRIIQQHCLQKPTVGKAKQRAAQQENVENWKVDEKRNITVANGGINDVYVCFL